VTGLEHIETLIDTIAGEPRAVPPIVDHAAYRVVRGALDAAVCATETSVAIEYVPGALVIEVEDDCRCARDLEELEELAAAIGGGLNAKRTADGSFRVRAWLPTEGQPPSSAAPPTGR
jgi:hypothetical protein